MDDPAAFRERYPLQTMRLPDGEPFAYRYHRNPSARATIVLLPGGIGLSCSTCILNGSPRTARSSPSIIRSGSRRTPNWRVPSQVEADASPDTDAAAPASDGVGRDAQDARPVVWRTAADAGPVRCLKQLLSKPYQRHMADLLIDAASHADMVTADFARWAGRVLLILRRRPHLQSGEQGRAGTPDAGSDRRHRSHRRSSRAVGAHGRVHGYRTRLHRVACGPLLAGVSSLASDPSAEAGTRAPRPAAPRWTARRARLVVCDA